MTATILPTPADLSITPRDRRFGREAATPRLWHGGRVEATAIYNALVDDLPDRRGLLRRERARVPRGRAAQARRGDQGASPRRKRSTAASMTRSTSARPTPATTSPSSRRRSRSGSRSRASKPPIVSLAATMALEHFTAILAHQLLANPRHLEGAEQRDRRPVALARGRGDRAQGRRLRHLAARDARLAALQALEGQGQGDALRHPQLRRRPHRRRARADAAGRRDRAYARGRCCCGTCGCGRACSARSPARGSNSSCPASTRGTRTTAHLLGAYDASASGDRAQAQGEARGLSRQRLLSSSSAASACSSSRISRAGDLVAARAAQPRRDDAERLEAELLEHPRRSGIVEEVRAFEAGAGRASGRCRSARRRPRSQSRGPRRAGRSNSPSRPRPTAGGRGRTSRPAAARPRPRSKIRQRGQDRIARAGEKRLGVAHAVGPRDVRQVAGDRLVGNRGGKRRRVFREARPQQQSWRSREHRSSPRAAA